MKMKRFYIHTIGCQMNVSDSSKLCGLLSSLGYSPASETGDADLVVVNTCTIRAKARQKAMSLVGRLAARKRSDPGLTICVSGCVAQEEGEGIIRMFPEVDIVLGTAALERMPVHLRRIEAGGGPVVDTDMTAGGDFDLITGPVTGVSHFVTIMRGCDNFCTYCVVPYVRGREFSRPPSRIVEEVRSLVARGVREVTLLGQNVNSYGKDKNGCSFARLLGMVNEIEGLLRIRFTTSHPKDLSPGLVDAFRNLDRLCSHIHLPVQSGSDRILERMNRKYTREEYLEKLETLRSAREGIALSSDIIVGFPGESERDFQQTLDLVRQVEFDSIFAFIYSDRPLAPASKFSDKVDEDEKRRRINTLLSLQNSISRRKNIEFEGRVIEVLVEGKSGRSGNGDALQWTGRDTTNRVVNFTVPGDCPGGAAVRPGCLAQVRIEAGLAHSLKGRAVAIADAFANVAVA